MTPGFTVNMTCANKDQILCCHSCASLVIRHIYWVSHRAGEFIQTVQF